MKRDLIDKKNQLYNSSIRLKTLKFINELRKDKQDIVTELIKEQDKQYRQWYFYREYLKAINKEKRK